MIKWYGASVSPCSTPATMSKILYRNTKVKVRSPDGDTEYFDIVVIRILREKEIYKYLGILETDTIKQVEMKEKIKKEHLTRTRKLLETKLYSRNLVKGINTWAVLLVRYLGLFLKWTGEELKQMDQRTRKLMTLHKALHPRDDVDTLYVSRGRKRTC